MPCGPAFPHFAIKEDVMDWFPLWNSLRIAAISSVIVFFSGILAA